MRHLRPLAFAHAAAGGLTGWLTAGQSADQMLSGFGFGESGGPLQFNHPRSIASDGTRLYVSDGHNNRVLVWLRAPDGNTPPDFALRQANLTSNWPGTELHQVHAWRRVEDAIAGRNADVVLGDPNPPAAPRITDRTFFWPGVPAFDGSYLWVGEFKFSGRIMRFSVR